MKSQRFFQLTMVLALISLLSLEAKAALTSVESTLMEQDRANALRMTNEFIVEFLKKEIPISASRGGSVSYSGGWDSDLPERFKNARCRQTCVRIAFIEENLPKAYLDDSCTVLYSWNDWRHWASVLDEKVMKEDKSDPTDQLPWYHKLYAKPFGWLQELFDNSEANEIIASEVERARAVYHETTRDCVPKK